MNYREYNPADNTMTGYHASYEEQFQQLSSSSPNNLQSSYEYIDRRMKENNPLMMKTFSDPRLNIPMMPPSSGSPIPKRPEATFVMDISPSVVGWIIGRSGIRIKEIQAQTGCKMWVDQDVPNDQPRKIYFHGSKANIDAAVGRVSELVQSAPILASASVSSGKGLTSTIVDCPVSLVGLLIGKRGWTIKKIQQASGAQISINQSVREGLPRKIIVSGDESSVATALHLIDEVLRDKSGLSQELDSSFDPSLGMNAIYLGGLDTYGRLDSSPLYDPRHQSQQGANIMYRSQAQQYQSMSGSPSSLMQNSPQSQSVLHRYPSPAPLRSVDDSRSRTTSYESHSLNQQNFQFEQSNGYDGVLAEHQYGAGGGGGDPYARQIRYSSDEQNGMPPSSLLVEDYLRKNIERGDVDRWNPQALSPASPLLAESAMMEYNPENGASAAAAAAHHAATAASSRQSRDDGSLLSFHLRQQHQKYLQQPPQQGHVFPLTQGKMTYRPSPQINPMTGTQPIFIPEHLHPQSRGGVGIAASPIDPSQRSLSDSSGAYRSSQSNSYHSSLSESPLNAGPYMLGSSPNESARMMPSAAGGVGYLHPGIALENRSRLSSDYQEQQQPHGYVSRSYPLNNSDPFSLSGGAIQNRNQFDDSNPLNRLHTPSPASFNDNTSMSHQQQQLLQQQQQPKDHNLSRSLPNYDHSHPSFMQQAYGFEQGVSQQDLSLYSPLYPEQHAQQASPPKPNPIYGEQDLYGFSKNFFNLSTNENTNLEAGLTGLLGHPNHEIDTLATSLGSVGSGSLASYGHFSNIE